MAKSKRPAAYSEIQSAVGQRIAWVRTVVMESQSDAAKTLNMDQSTLNKIEKGTRAPSIFNILQISNRFRVSTDFLLRGLLHAKSDEELALKLAALHPELVLQPEHTVPGTDTPPVSDTPAPPKKGVRGARKAVHA